MPNYLSHIWQADRSADKHTVEQSVRNLVVMRSYLAEYLPPWGIFVPNGAWNIEYFHHMMERWPQLAISPPPQLPNFVQQVYGKDHDHVTRHIEIYGALVSSPDPTLKEGKDLVTLGRILSSCAITCAEWPCKAEIWLVNTNAQL